MEKTGKCCKCGADLVSRTLVDLTSTQSKIIKIETKRVSTSCITCGLVHDKVSDEYVDGLLAKLTDL